MLVGLGILMILFLQMLMSSISVRYQSLSPPKNSLVLHTPQLKNRQHFSRGTMVLFHVTRTSHLRPCSSSLLLWQSRSHISMSNFSWRIWYNLVCFMSLIFLLKISYQMLLNSPTVSHYSIRGNVPLVNFFLSNYYKAYGMLPTLKLNIMGVPSAN